MTPTIERIRSIGSRSSKRSLPGSSMWPRLAALAAPLAFRVLGLAATVGRGDPHGLLRVDLLVGRLGGQSGRGLLGLADHLGAHLVVVGLSAAAGVLGIALEQAREERRGDEDRRHGADHDPDDDREGEVLERRAAEDEQRR